MFSLVLLCRTPVFLAVVMAAIQVAADGHQVEDTLLQHQHQHPLKLLKLWRNNRMEVNNTKTIVAKKLHFR